jgi:thiol-disulfide isomerase/thioredoxin
VREFGPGFLGALLWTGVVTAHVTGPAIGTDAPLFQARNLVTGEKLELAAERGKLVILTFWATWCGPCRRELPILERAQEVLGKDKLTVFAVNYRDTPQAAAALKRMAKGWQLTLVEDSNGSIANHYGISSIPHLFIINRTGRVVANHLGYGDRTVEDLVNDINKALAEQTVVAPGQG